MPASPSEICEQCMIHSDQLRKCSDCNTARYCSKECQRLHWKTHKPDCRDNLKTLKMIEVLGSDYTSMYWAISQWRNFFAHHISTAAVSALDLVHHPENLERFVFFIFIESLGEDANGRFTHQVIDFDMMPLEDAHSAALQLSPQELERFKRTVSPRPGVMQVMVRDVHFPFSHPMPVGFPPLFNPALLTYDPAWFAHLQEAVVRPGYRVCARKPGAMSRLVAPHHILTERGGSADAWKQLYSLLCE